MRTNWNFIFFIARTLQKQSVEGKKVARPITRIATISIALAMIVNTVTIAIVDGFQQEVSSKVIGFGSHISIQKDGEGTLIETAPLLRDKKFEDLIRSIDGVTSLQSVAYKPALLQSSSNKGQKEILGVILKGVDKSYDWHFFKTHLIAGRIPFFATPQSNELLVSKSIAQNLHYSLGDTVAAFFVKQQPIQREFKIVGIFETGLADFDKELVVCSIDQVQQLNDWGIQAAIEVDDTLTNGELVIRANVVGGNGNYRYDWGNGFERYAGYQICPTKDTVIRLIAADYWSSIDEPTGATQLRDGETSIADTAFLKITLSGNKNAPCLFQLTDERTINKKYLDETGNRFQLNAGFKNITFASTPGKGSFSNYVGSYELMIRDFEALEKVKRSVQKAVVFNPNFSQTVQVKSIKDNQRDLFVWLSFLDINMAIVLLLMLVIGIINMGSALLVMILLRSSFIGVFKAMGATNWQLRKVFLVHFGKLILKGMLWGNFIGIGICLLQANFHLIPLDPKIYYLDAVPVSISIFSIIGLNVITLIICLSALLIPSYLVAKIAPSKAMRMK